MVVEKPALTESARKKIKSLHFSSKQISFLKLVAFCAVALLAVGVWAYIHGIVTSDVSLMLYLDGKPIGTVESLSTANDAMELLSLRDSTSNVSGNPTGYNCNFTYGFVTGSRAGEQKPLDANECMEEIYAYVSANYVKAYTISVDGRDVCSTANEVDASAAVARLKNRIADAARSEYGDDVKVNPANDITITEMLCAKDVLVVSSEVYDTLARSLVGENSDYAKYLTARQDNKEITPSDEMTYSKLSAFSSGSDKIATLMGGSASIGTMKGVTQTKPSDNGTNPDTSLALEATRVEVVNGVIPCETLYEKSDEYYVGYSKLLTKGKNGETKLTYEVKYVNGEEVSRTLLSGEIISDPVNYVYLVGSKPTPLAIPTGEFEWPLKDYIITSYYHSIRPGIGYAGPHLGIDLYAPKGNSIFAADGGVVTFAAWHTSYGYMVKISHGNGVETRYAHMSKILVNVGDSVYKGQEIGLVGSTGDAQGYHLHFEVIVNDETRDPMDWLPAPKKEDE